MQPDQTDADQTPISAEEAMREADEAMRDPVVVEVRPFVPRQTGILIDYIEGDGTERKAALMYGVPGTEDYAKMAIFRGGPRWAHVPVGVDPMTDEMLRRVCYLEATIARPRPDWINDFGKIDPTLLNQIFEEVAKYERRFRDRCEHRGESFVTSGVAGGSDDVGVGAPVESAG
jgi:hypothetical protein